MNCKNSYWIKGAWHSRPCASSTRWIGSYGNLLSSRDHCGETLVLLEAKEQRPVRTGRAGCGDSHFISGTRAGGHQPSSSWQSHSWMAKGGWAVTNINGSCTYAKFSFFGQIFHFLPGSQQPVEQGIHGISSLREERGCWMAHLWEQSYWGGRSRRAVPSCVHLPFRQLTRGGAVLYAWARFLKETKWNGTQDRNENIIFKE